MATKKRKSNKFGITPSVIFFNLALVLLIIIVIFFTYNVIKGEDNASSVVPPFTAVTDKSESVSSPESVTSSDISSSATSSTPTESTDTSSDNSVNSNTSSDTESSENNNSDDTPSSFYDREYFNSSLFIGDSISTGLSLYGFLDADNVFATQGLAPSTAATAEIDGVTLSGKISTFRPEKIFIMLGTNSVGYAEADYLADSMKMLISDIEGMCKSDIYVLSIPPVTADAEADSSNYLSLEAINEYNSQLKAAVSETNAKFLDFNAVLRDDSGYFNADYAEVDGIHFMGSTYQVMLSFLQTETDEE